VAGIPEGTARRSVSWITESLFLGQKLWDDSGGVVTPVWDNSGGVVTPVWDDSGVVVAGQSAG